MRVQYGVYLVLPLKYDGAEVTPAGCKRISLTTADLTENVKNMLSGEGEQAVGKVYRVPRAHLTESLSASGAYGRCRITGGADYEFDILDSYLYVFHTRIALLCLGLAVPGMEALYAICNPGFADNKSQFYWLDQAGGDHPFSLEAWLERLCGAWGLRKFFDGDAPLVPEAYTYILALRDKPFASLEELRQLTFNLHQMQNPDTPVEDDSEADIRYVYAVKDPDLGGYRWGCCVASQTISYAVGDPSLEFHGEMATQAADGLPIVLLALYEKYTCLRFTELIAQPRMQELKPMQELKKLMLRFQAFGTVTPANLSRWNNVKQIYSFLLEVHDAAAAVQDISTKISILAEQQQEIENERSARVVNLITFFGIVGIVSSVQSIVQILADGDDLMWSVTVLTSAVLAVVFGIAWRKPE